MDCCQILPRAWLALIVLAWVTALPVMAQSESPETEEPPPDTYDPLNRTTPERLVLGFVAAMADGNHEKAAQYFNLNKIPARQRTQRGIELAQNLQQLLDRGGMFAPRWQLSEDPRGVLDDNLPPEQEQVGTLPSPEGTQAILAERIEDEELGWIWVFSSETVSQIPELVEQLPDSTLSRLLPQSLSDPLWKGVSLGHWVAALILALIATFSAWLLVKFLGFLAPRISRAHLRPYVRKIRDAASPPLILILAIMFFFSAAVLVGLSIIARQYLASLADILLIIAGTWLVLRLIDLIGETSTERVGRRGWSGALAAVILFRRFSKAAVVAIALMIALDLFGFDVTAGLAALGIGGLAIALGAQKTVENFVGSLTLIADQPIRVGDFCRFGTTLGTVEDIGMRSTRVRTLDRTVITIPNGVFSSMEIENYNRRDQFWFHPTLNLRLETTPDQIRYLLVELRAMLYAHPKVNPDPARVRFTGLTQDAAQLEIFAYIQAADVNDFMEVQEDLLLRILDIIDKSGTGLALPSQTLYFARDQGLDQSRTQAAEDQVRQWQEAGELQLPRFDPERIAKLRNSIPYPPPGTAMGKRQ